jgi:Leucine-rich repeat (LRR) protein
MNFLARTTTTWNKKNISAALLRELEERCPNLRRLTLVSCNLTDITVNSLPASTESLSVTDSLTPVDWFRSLQSHGDQILPRLIELDLTNSTKTSNADLQCIASARPRLTSLKLNGCYRVTIDGLKSVADGLPCLTVLEVGGTRCNDLAVHHICRALPGLCRFSLASCTQIQDGSVATIVAMLRCLKWLCLSGCRGVTDAGFESLTKCTASLRWLLVDQTTVTEEVVARLGVALPSCTVIS